VAALARKAEAQVLFETALLMQDLGRFSADVLLFYTQEFAFVALPDEFTTGSSIMPQKRNPDVFELIRGRSATAQACLTEALGICAKLPSGLSTRSAAAEGPAVSRHRRGGAHARHPDAGHRRDAVPPGEYQPGSGDSRRGRSQRHGGARGHPFREAYRRVGHLKSKA
jgi:argininosuccinate lyase